MRNKYLLAAIFSIAMTSISEAGCTSCGNINRSSHSGHGQNYQTMHRYNSFSHQSQEDRYTSEGDKQILNKVREILQRDEYKDLNIHVSVEYGKVVLDGKTYSQDVKDDIQSQVSEIPGVRFVIMDVYVDNRERKNPNNSRSENQRKNNENSSSKSWWQSSDSESNKQSNQQRDNSERRYDSNDSYRNDQRDWNRNSQRNNNSQQYDNQMNNRQNNSGNGYYDNNSQNSGYENSRNQGNNNYNDSQYDYNNSNRNGQSDWNRNSQRNNNSQQYDNQMNNRQNNSGNGYYDNNSQNSGYDNSRNYRNQGNYNYRNQYNSSCPSGGCKRAGSSNRQWQNRNYGQQQQNNQPYYYEDYQNQSSSGNQSRNQQSNQNVSDSQLKSQIESKLQGGWFSKSYPNVKVQVNNGNVTLKGDVANQDDKQSIAEEVKSMDGVRKLDNRIQLNQQNKNNSYKNGSNNYRN